MIVAQGGHIATRKAILLDADAKPAQAADHRPAGTGRERRRCDAGPCRQRVTERAEGWLTAAGASRRGAAKFWSGRSAGRCRQDQGSAGAAAGTGRGRRWCHRARRGRWCPKLRLERGGEGAQALARPPRGATAIHPGSAPGFSVASYAEVTVIFSISWATRLQVGCGVFRFGAWHVTLRQNAPAVP
jgi:hypothetical protein